MRQLYEYAKKDLQTSNSHFHGFIPTGTVNSDTKAGVIKYTARVENVCGMVFFMLASDY